MRMTVGRSWNDGEIRFPENGPRQSVKSVCFRALPLFFFHSYFFFWIKMPRLGKRDADYYTNHSHVHVHDYHGS